MSKRARRLGPMLLIVGGLHSVRISAASAQEAVGAAIGLEPLSVSASFDGAGWVRADSAITFALSRLPSPSEGRVAVVVGMTDLTSLFDRSGTTLRYRPRSLPLPSGESEVIGRAHV